MDPDPSFKLARDPDPSFKPARDPDPSFKLARDPDPKLIFAFLVQSPYSKPEKGIKCGYRKLVIDKRSCENS